MTSCKVHLWYTSESEGLQIVLVQPLQAPKVPQHAAFSFVHVFCRISTYELSCSRVTVKSLVVKYVGYLNLTIPDTHTIQLPL